jgi:hypothetical protein
MNQYYDIYFDYYICIITELFVGGLTDKSSDFSDTISRGASYIRYINKQRKIQMTTLELYTKETLELVIDNNTGEIFATLEAMVHMTGSDAKTINKYVNGGLQGAYRMELKHSGFHTPEGIKGAALLNEFQIISTLHDYNSSLLADIALEGIRAFFHPLVGYKPSSMLVPPTTTNTNPSPKVSSKQSLIEYVNANHYIEQLQDETLRRLLTDLLIKELSELQGK